METMIVEIFIPAISGSFDFQVPSAGLVGEMIGEIVEILEQTQPGLTFDRDYPMLCHLLGVEPAPVDGKLQRIKKILK